VEHIAVHSFKLPNKLTINLEFSQLINRQGNGFAWFIENAQRLVGDESRAPREYGKIGTLDDLSINQFLGYTATPNEKKFTVLPFTHRACMDSELTGGKGANLSRLTGLQHQVRTIFVKQTESPHLVHSTKRPSHNYNRIPASQRKGHFVESDFTFIGQRIGAEL
jgi:hypothetical protein